MCHMGKNQCWADITFFLDPPVPIIHLFVIHWFWLLLLLLLLKSIVMYFKDIIKK